MTAATAEATTIDITVERTIPASPAEVFDAWLDPKSPSNPWNQNLKLILDPTVGSLFYWLTTNGKGAEVAHYGLFTDVQRPHRLQHTWMSPNTNGVESVVTVTLTEQGDDTLFTLQHTGLPSEQAAKGHTGGWNHFLDGFSNVFPARATKA